MSWCRCKLAGTRHFLGYHRRSHVSRQTCAGGFWFSFSFLSFTLIFYLKIVSSWCKCKLAGTRHFVGYHRQSHVSRQTCAGGFWSSFWLLSFTLMWGSNLASYIPYSGPLGISLPSFDIRGISPLHPSSKVKPRMGVKFPVRRDFTRNNEKKWNVASRVCTTPNLNHTLQKTTQNSWKWANFTWFSTLWDDIALEKDQRRHH